VSIGVLLNLDSRLRGNDESHILNHIFILLSAPNKEHESLIKKGKRIMSSYYEEKDLPRFPEIGQDGSALAEKFFAYYQAVFAQGELTEREKALIALAVAHAVQCPYCIDAYTQASLEKGSSLTEMTEAVHVAVAIRGGASLIHGIQMRNAAQKISM
jgi:alkylhydroperoxidase/carboxymuconolactone decarboxylase family protein